MSRGANTREYLTILYCTSLLVTAVEDNILVLSSELLAEGLITPVNYGTLRNLVVDKTERATKLVEFIRNKILLNSKNYYSFIKILEKERENYRDILFILNEKLCDKEMIFPESPPGSNISTSRSKTILYLLVLLVLSAVVSVYTSDEVLTRMYALSKRFLVSIGFIPGLVDHSNSSEIEVPQKDAYYVAGSYMVTETFGKDYAVFLQYLAPDYGRVILDLENSGTGNVIYHSSMRYAGCTRGIYRESNVLVMNSLLNGEWGKVERPIAKGFPFNSSEKISITVTATEMAYKFSVQSGISTFTYHYTYRYGTDPENVDRINSYIIEYRECPPLKKGEVLDYGFGKQISDFRVGTVIAIHGIAPPNLGQIVSVRIVQKVSVSEKNKDPLIVNVSVKEINPGEKFSITIRIREDSIHLSVNGGSFHMHTFEKGRKIDDISQSATIWISGIYHLIRIDAI